MGTPRIFQQSELLTGMVHGIEGQAAQHLLRVLRCRPGDPVILFNGDGHDYAGSIESTQRNRLTVRIDAVIEMATESPLPIHLGIPLAKGQRMDYAIQKAVELGVTEITPLTTARSVVRLDSKRLEGKEAHWRQVAIAACEQCGRARVPPLHAVEPLDAWSRRAAFGIVLDPRHATPVTALQRPATSVHLVAGPEGGFTAPEITALREQGFHAVTLGPRILRTETAPLAAITALQLLWGDFGQS
ncbi:MAG: 16S rRNA (uracil(1498)-N(3))-methyltransferase [Gammaproteobacteria bacterium]|jgi:16S rRNA (uracil1498-N3)-methyltransferase